MKSSARCPQCDSNSYRAAEKQEVGRHSNNRAENSHLPFRRQERAMLRFRRMKTLPKFASVHANVQNHFNAERHLVDRSTYKGSAKPHWPSGAASWPERPESKAEMHETEICAHWSNSTA